MVARLPKPGSDQNVWGDILNEFLLVEHDSDGTLKADGTIATKANDSSVVHNSGAETIAGTKTFLASPIVPSPTNNNQAATKQYVDSAAGASVPDATTTSKGIIQLAGDLAGTADAPTVPDLASKADDSDVVHRAGSETVTGAKDFTGGVTVNGTNVVVTDDTRLSDERTPLDNSVTTVKIQNGAVTDAKLASGIAQNKISGLSAALASKEDTANKGMANGYAGLDAGGDVPIAQLPALALLRSYQFSNTGTLVVAGGTHRLYNDSGAAWAIQSIRASVGTQPTGASVIIDVNINNTTIFTNQANRPAIAASSNTSGAVTNFDISTVANGSYLTVDVDQIGSSEAGGNLTVQVEVI